MCVNTSQNHRSNTDLLYFGIIGDAGSNVFLGSTSLKRQIDLSIHIFKLRHNRWNLSRRSLDSHWSTSWESGLRRAQAERMVLEIRFENKECKKDGYSDYNIF